MIQEKAPSNESPISVSLFRFFVITLALSLAATVAVVYLNRTIATAIGKVINRTTETAFSSRKSSYQEDVVIVAFTINGKERTGKTPVPRHGGGSTVVPVHYYPALPMFPWFYTKNNANLLYCSMALAVSLVGFLLSWQTARKHWRTIKK